MANKLTMAHERRKLQVRGMLLQNRATIAKLQERNKALRAELSTLRTRPKRSESVPGLRSVNL